MNADTFQASAEQAFNALPARFRQAMHHVVIVTDEFADAGLLREMGIDSPYDLLGLYQGRSQGGYGISESGELPDMIHLYRQPILAAARAEAQPPEHLLIDVLIHEIGHYFGFSDAEMAVIERQRAEAAQGEDLAGPQENGQENGQEGER
jgi:predicted Zn-dependent protease with MMP-like domain